MRRSALLVSAALLAGCGSSAVTRVSPEAAAKPAASNTTSTTLASSTGAAGTTTALDTTVASPIITGTDLIIEGTPLPPVPTIDLHTGNIVRLDWLLPGPKPVLVWFWAPH
jgi:hypothetical protein